MNAADPLNRILLVDDEAEVTRAISLVASEYFETTCASSGVDALAVLGGSRAYAVVVSDLRMPAMDGITLLERVRREYPNVIRLLLSGTVDLESTLSAVNRGGVHRILVKPVSSETLIDTLTWAVEEYNARERERALALEDALLQIGSRRAFDKAVARHNDHALRYRHPYGIIMIDVDHFKPYNDTYGHPAGDRILQLIAATLRQNKRGSDELYRYGGEELVCILPNTPWDAVLPVMERFRVVVEGLREAHVGDERGLVTISLGAAAFDPELPVDFQTLLKRADQALYESKREGRNRSTLWR